MVTGIERIAGCLQTAGVKDQYIVSIDILHNSKQMNITRKISFKGLYVKIQFLLYKHKS